MGPVCHLHGCQVTAQENTILRRLLAYTPQTMPEGAFKGICLFRSDEQDLMLTACFCLQKVAEAAAAMHAYFAATQEYYIPVRVPTNAAANDEDLVTPPESGSTRDESMETEDDAADTDTW